MLKAFILLIKEAAASKWKYLEKYRNQKMMKMKIIKMMMIMTN
jgi:hypothetical protein